MFAFSVLTLLVSTQGHAVVLATVQFPIAHPARGLGSHVLVVSNSTGPYFDIQPAVDAASEGDVVLVKPGFFSGFTIHDKAITVVSDPGSCSVQGHVVLDGLSASKTVLLSGFSPFDIAAQHVAGSLRVQGLYTSGGAVLDDVADAAFSACTLRGAEGGQDPTHPLDGAPGAPALAVLSSSVAVYDCDIQGGMGGPGMQMNTNDIDGGNGGRGGAALRVEDGFVFCSGTMLKGGEGGWGANSLFCANNSAPGDGGPGGACIVVIGDPPPSPNVTLLGNVLTPGPGGQGGIDESQYCYGDGTPGAPGVEVTAPAGAVEFLSGSSSRFVMPRIARENTSVAMSFFGTPGATVLVLASPTPTFSFQGNLNGVVLTASAGSRVVASGTLHANGILNLPFSIQSSGADAKVTYYQAYFRDPTNDRFVASPISFVQVDPAY